MLRFRVLGASFSRFGCFVLQSSFLSASFSKLLDTKMVGERFFLTTFFVLLKVSYGWTLPDYLPTVRNINGNNERNYLIEQYFHHGLSYSEIMSFLVLSHGVRLSLRQLKRILRSRGL